MLLDTSIRYSLPDAKLSEYAGCEWADNDFRVFCGFFDVERYHRLMAHFLSAINQLTGPGWAGWPFGIRQLADAVVVWSKSVDALPEVLLLASTRQHGVKHAYLNQSLYCPIDRIGAWTEQPHGWDCRQAVRFLYQARLMLHDGLPEIALGAAISSLENASAEALLHLLGGNASRVEQELDGCRFLDRFDGLLPRYGASLPHSLFLRLREAYFARNGVVHGLRPVTPEKAVEHLDTIEEVLVWLWDNIGDGAARWAEQKRREDDCPF
jgi:hypothetical protein